jgi:putative oxidoreductase
MIDHRTAPYAVLLLRVSLGSLFIAHLYWKFAILNGGLNTWWANFATNGYPSIVPWYCISAEFVGAICLIPGFYARWVCLYALPLIAGVVEKLGADETRPGRLRKNCR